MKGQNLSRLLSLVLLLRSREQVSAQELGGRFGVAPRTIYRDLATLQRAGVPVAGQRGPSGGFYLTSNVDLYPGALVSDATLVEFLTGGQAVGRSAVGRREAVNRALEKAEEVLSGEEKELIHRTRERIFIDTEDWYWRDQPERDLQVFKDAVISDKRLAITFYERDSPLVKRSVLDPYGLVWKGGFWYVVGHSQAEKRFRRYRVPRIISATLTGEVFSRLPFHIKDFWRSDLEMFGKGVLRVALRINAGVISEFENFNWKEDSVIERHADHWLVEMHVDHFDWLVPLILSFGGDVTVTEPEELRVRIAVGAERLMRMHRYNGPYADATVSKTDDSRSRVTRGREI